VTDNYDGSVPASTLVFCPGDNVTVHLVNDLKQPTNLHVHGLHVSPKANHDNVFLNIRPGQRFTYQYSIPLDHDPGAFWFHGHRHHFVVEQMYGGMAGAIVVEGGLDDWLANIPQRIMVLQAMELCDSTGHSVPFGSSGSEPCSTPAHTFPFLKSLTKYTPWLVNGAFNPTVRIRPGQIQRWRLFNAAPDTLIKVRLAGQPIEVLAQDGNTLLWTRPTRVLLLGPGQRREILVRGARLGRYRLRTLPFSQFPDRKVKGQTLLTVLSSDKRVADRMPEGPLASPIDLRRKHVDRYRRVIFSEKETPPGSGNRVFLLNHHAFDPNYVPITMKLNSVEQWTLVNTNTERHTYPIHQNPFQVISVNGRR
jgi:suppressor of ftsI